MIYYYKTPNYCVAINPKVGCTSFAKAIINTFYPDIDKEINNTSTIFHGPKYILLCPKIQIPNKPVVCLVRDPIERFASAINETGINIDEAVKCLLNDEYYHFPIYSKPKRLREDGHFRQQFKLITNEAHLFKFPEEIEIMANFIGISKIDNLNKSDRKIELKQKHIDFILDYYYKDFELYKKVSKHLYDKY